MKKYFLFFFVFLFFTSHSFAGNSCGDSNHGVRVFCSNENMVPNFGRVGGHRLRIVQKIVK